MGNAMAWGSWMVPTLSTSDEFELEKRVRIIKANAASSPDRLAALAIDLMRQNMVYSSIISQATKHICELELKQELGDNPRWRVKMHPVVAWWRAIAHHISRPRAN